MNQGKIEVQKSGPVIVEIVDGIEHEYPMHPFFKYKTFEDGQPVNFQLAMECHRHFPVNCHCLKLTTFALPVIKKDQTSWFKKLFRK